MPPITEAVLLNDGGAMSSKLSLLLVFSGGLF